MSGARGFQGGLLPLEFEEAEHAAGSLRRPRLTPVSANFLTACGSACREFWRFFRCLRVCLSGCFVYTVVVLRALFMRGPSWSVELLMPARSVQRFRYSLPGQNIRRGRLVLRGAPGLRRMLLSWSLVRFFAWV